MNRSGWYREPVDPLARDAAVIARFNEIFSRQHRSRWGFWKCFDWMRFKGETWNHKRVLRVYRAMRLNLPRRAKRRLPERIKEPLNTPAQANHTWSMDFVHDTLYHGKRFRTLNILDEGVREILAIEVDTSLPAERVIRVLDQLKESRGLPAQIRVDNGPELISAKLVAWCEIHHVRLHHIQPGRPTQNAYIERFNRTFRNEVLDANLFGSLSEVREIVHQWMIDYNEERPHRSLGKIPPSHYRQNLTTILTPEDSTFEMSC